MKINKLFSLTLLCVFAFSITVSAQSVFTGKVTEVIDGRTAVFTTEKGVRTMILLNNIEVPEPEQELSKIVKEHFSKLALNKNARFYVGYEYSKGYTGKLFIEDNEINKQMIRDGAAWYNLPENELATDRGQYLEIEIAAKTEKRGVWGIAGLKPAWQFREDKFNKEVEAKNLARKKATEKAAAAAIEARKNTPAVEWMTTPSPQTSVASRFKSVFGGENDSVLTTNYDKFSGKTTTTSPYVQLGLSSNSEQLEDISVRAVKVFEGTKSNGNETYFIVFTSLAANWKLLKYNDLSILTNKLRIKIDNPKMDSEVKSIGGITVCVETLIFPVSLDTFSKIVNTSRIELQLGFYQGDMTDYEIASLRSIMK